MQLSIFERHAHPREPLRATLLNRKAELLLALELHSRYPLAASGAERLRRVLSGKLSRVEEALHRMDSGSFGDCVLCGETISEERLRVLPWETHCTACKKNGESSLPHSSVPVGNPATESPTILFPIPKSA